MFSMILAFIVMINPVGLFLYLQPVMRKLSKKDFSRVLAKASLISLSIYCMFLLLGDLIFDTIFQIRFDSFRIFGGIVLFSFAYSYIVKGQKALLDIRGNLDDLAAEIALPFMVGAGSISLTFVTGDTFDTVTGLAILVISVVICFITIIGLRSIRDSLKSDHWKVAFDKNMEIVLRLNGFFVGAIGINMMITGIKKIFFANVNL